MPENSLQGAPEKVRKAAFSGDTEALRAMQRKSTEKRLNNIADREVMDERTAERRAAEEAFRREQSGENIIPPTLE